MVIAQGKSPKMHLTEKYHSWQESYTLNSGRNQLGVTLGNLDTKKIGAEIFGELRNAVLEKNGEDKMARERE